MIDTPNRESRLDRLARSVQGAGATMWAHARSAVRNPMRVLLVVLGALLVILAVPLLVTGALRLRDSWSDWRHATTVTSDWTQTRATIEGVRLTDGIDLELSYRDRQGTRHRTEVHVGAPGSEWITSPLPIRYDPADKSNVDLVGIADPHPAGRALVAGAGLGAGAAAALLAFSMWRRRRSLATADDPLTVLRTPLVLSGALLVAGLGAWAVGTITTQGWTSVVNRIGVRASSLFGGFMTVLVPVLAFAAGALVYAWLTRHRHHESHTGVLGRAHGMIDRASEYMPSPDQLGAADQDETAGRQGPTGNTNGPAADTEGSTSTA
ncbi:MAG TPA: hypothetical protein VFF40_09295 [Acidimicrobiia bacterium]|nr:hypothetical protein [Acidimicrobiia bacterium]